MRYPVLILLLVIQLGCGHSTENSRDPVALNETLYRAVLAGDSTTIMNLASNKFFWDGRPNDDLLKFLHVEHFKNKSAVVIDSDTTDGPQFGIGWSKQSNVFHTSFRIDSTYYLLHGSFKKDSTGQIWLSNLSIIDLNQFCNLGMSTVSIPKIQFIELLYNTDDWNRAFENGQIRMQNNDDFDVAGLRFRLRIYHNTTLIFNKSIKTSQKLISRDMTLVSIPEMQGYAVGRPIRGQGQQITWQYEIESYDNQSEPMDCWPLREVQKLEKKK
jgi:hypothetical protein